MHLNISAPATAVAGTAVSLTVYASDLYGNVATSYTGTVHFTSTDGNATLPADTTITGGTGTFSATLKTPGSQTITATDTVNSLSRYIGWNYGGCAELCRDDNRRWNCSCNQSDWSVTVLSRWRRGRWICISGDKEYDGKLPGHLCRSLSHPARWFEL